MTKKSNNVFPTLISFALVVSSSIVAMSSTPSYALSLSDVINELPIIGSRDNEQAQPSPATMTQAPQTTATSPLTPILDPIINMPQPTQEVTPSVQTPLPVSNPVPAIIQPIVTPPKTVATAPKTSAPAVTKTPAASSKEMNVHTAVAVTRITPEAPAAVLAVASSPVDTSSEVASNAAARSNRGDFFAEYMSSRISDARRNQLYGIGIAVTLVGISLYLFTLRTQRTFVFPNWLRKLVTT